MQRARKNWVCAEYWATKASLEVAQSALSELHAIGIEVDDGSTPKGPKYPHDKILVKAFFEDRENLVSDVKEVLATFFKECELPLDDVTFSVIEEEDWQGNFVRSCTTLRVEPDIFIVPSFEMAEFKKNPAGPLFIEMDPENAFGTGQHQTTQLCLTAIHAHASDAGHSFSQQDCLDIGTGSGILAILMKKMGAGSVLATETDEDALITAKKNAQQNCVAIKTEVVSESHRYPKRAFDLVVANILAPVLRAMAPEISHTLRAQGLLILSGILLEQAADVIDAYKDLGLEFLRQETMNDWCALIFRQNS